MRCYKSDNLHLLEKISETLTSVASDLVKLSTSRQMYGLFLQVSGIKSNPKNLGNDGTLPYNVCRVSDY
jgi:hypothetical protein